MDISKINSQAQIPAKGMRGDSRAAGGEEMPGQSADAYRGAVKWDDKAVDSKKAREVHLSSENNWMASDESRKRILLRPVESGDKEWVLSFMIERWGSQIIVNSGIIYYPSELPGFVALAQGEMAGLITYEISGEDCEIVSIDSLRPSQGIGSTLIEAVKNVALQSCCRRLWLITTNDNLHALRFYQKRGFTLVAFRKDAVAQSRLIKPQIPLTGNDGIPLRDEIELELPLISINRHFQGKEMRREKPHPRQMGKEGFSRELGNLYRFAEPIVLLSIARLGEAHGYSIAQSAENLAVTHSKLDTGVIYRTLQNLEKTGRVTPAWDRSGAGPARKVYRLTEEGWTRISEWADAIEKIAFSLTRLRNVSREVMKEHNLRS